MKKNGKIEVDASCVKQIDINILSGKKSGVDGKSTYPASFVYEGKLYNGQKNIFNNGGRVTYSGRECNEVEVNNLLKHFLFRQKLFPAFSIEWDDAIKTLQGLSFEDDDTKPSMTPENS